MTKHINKGKQMLKVLGSVGMLVLLFWVMADAAGLGVFIEIYSLVIVFGGAALFWLAAGGVGQGKSLGLDSYGRGAIYFGWLGTAIGVIGMAHNWTDIDPDVLGPASAIAMLTLLYGYLIAWVAVPAIKSLTQDG